jgi:putative nucleotidyltransferase with HDIG domain
MLIDIAPDQVTLGMYVHGFRGSWLQHPFWRARFIITDISVLEAIHDSAVDAVIIDDSKGKGLSPPEREQKAAPAAAPRRLDTRREPLSQSQRNGEIERARKIIARGKMLVMRLFDDARMGRLTLSAPILELVEDISKSLERSQSTLLNMARLKSKDEYTYLHSVAVCALMIGFARQRGLGEDAVRELGIAGLYHDVGKAAVPSEVLNKAGRLSPEEFDSIKAHTISGRELLERCEDVPQVAIDVALHHHERMDGTGYPFGLKGSELSVAARMGAICDIYDALTSERVYKEAWTPSEAISNMDQWDGHMDPELLFTFMKSVGLFPPGLLVRLRSNRLAIILPNGRRGSRAKARAFYAIPEKMFIEAEDVSLKESAGHDAVVSREEPAHWPLQDWAALSEALLAGDYRAADHAASRAA